MMKSFIGFNPLRSEDAGTDGGYPIEESVVETGEEEMETAEPSDEEGAEEQEVAEPVEEESKSDAAFAQMRRDLEAAQKRASELEEQIQEYDDALVRRLVETITVYDDRFKVKFKSGIEIEVAA